MENSYLKYALVCVKRASRNLVYCYQIWLNFVTEQRSFGTKDLDYVISCGEKHYFQIFVVQFWPNDIVLYLKVRNQQKKSGENRGGFSMKYSLSDGDCILMMMLVLPSPKAVGLFGLCRPCSAVLYSSWTVDWVIFI